MGQFKKCILRILSVVCLTCLVFGITACKQNSNSKDNRDKNILAVYDVYVAYAKENGTTPLSYEEWLESIKGKDGTNGVDGKSAYQIWLDNGHTGTETDFLNCLKGKDGTNGTNGKDGVNGTNGKDGVDGINGTDGKSAYQIWLDNGHTRTETDFLNWLKGKNGTNGTNGKDGVDGKDGQDGTNGKDGVDGKDGNGIKSAVINNKGELIITLDDGTIINAGQVVSPEKRIDENNKIICKTFEKTDKTIYGKVSNDTEIFYFTDEIEFVGNASYAVYRDFECTDEIISKSVKLAVGDNVFYLIEKCGNDSKFYTVTVRRREIYTVTFAVNDSTLLENPTIKIEEDGLIPKDNIPSSPRAGYDLVWDYEFTKPITQNTEIIATWTAIYIISGNTIKGLTDYGKTLSVLNIPSEIDGNKLTNIGNDAFHSCTSLANINIPESVTSIGDGAFYSCTSLTSMVLPEGITSIGNNAFWGCCLLTSIVLPDGTTSIGNDTFRECTSLTNINIPQSVTSIGNGAFFWCTSLTSMVLPEGLTSIGNSVFRKCTSLTSITIPNSVTTIGNLAFGECNLLTSITISESVTDIANDAFNGCNSLKEVVFESPENWVAKSGNTVVKSFTAEELSNATTAASLLKRYSSYSWKKEN